MNRLARTGYIAAGTIFMALAVIGIFLPVLPTTPFLLLAAACYARGSQRLLDWLLTNRLVGRYIRDYREGRGVPLRQKLFALIALWAMIGVSGWYSLESWWLRLLLVAIAAWVTQHLLRIRPTRKPVSPHMLPGEAP